jgi:hypothetical protein
MLHLPTSFFLTKNQKSQQEDNSVLLFFAEHQEARIISVGTSWLEDRRKQVCKDMQDA